MLSSFGPIPFVIASSAHGLGAIATKDIVKGELLVVETPLIVQNETRTAQSILSVLCTLPQNENQAYLNLHNAFGEIIDPILGIFNTNCLPLAPIDPVSSNGNILEYGLFLHLSRLNNSCAPNASITWHERTRQMSVHALEHIQCGEEITISYGQPLFLSRADRRAFLQHTSGFLCLCSCCGLSVDASRISDSRRAELARLFKAVPFLGHDAPAGVRAASKALQGLQIEGIHLYQDLFSWDAYQFCIALGDIQQAQQWLSRAYQFKVISSGRESDAAQFFAQTMLLLPRG